jgi:hypothetical protein
VEEEEVEGKRVEGVAGGREQRRWSRWRGSRWRRRGWRGKLEVEQVEGEEVEEKRVEGEAREGGQRRWRWVGEGSKRWGIPWGKGGGEKTRGAGEGKHGERINEKGIVWERTRDVAEVGGAEGGRTGWGNGK